MGKVLICKQTCLGSGPEGKSYWKQISSFCCLPCQLDSICNVTPSHSLLQQLALYLGCGFPLDCESTTLYGHFVPAGLLTLFVARPLETVISIDDTISAAVRSTTFFTCICNTCMYVMKTFTAADM